MNTQLGSTMMVVSGCFAPTSAAPVAGRSLAGQVSIRASPRYKVSPLITIYICFFVLISFLIQLPNFWPFISERACWNSVRQSVELIGYSLITIVMNKHSQVLVVRCVKRINQQKRIFALLDNVRISWLYLHSTLLNIIHSPLTSLLDFYERFCGLKLLYVLIVSIQYNSIPVTQAQFIAATIDKPQSLDSRSVISILGSHANMCCGIEIVANATWLDKHNNSNWHKQQRLPIKPFQKADICDTAEIDDEKRHFKLAVKELRPPINY